MTKYPSKKDVLFQNLIRDYEATNFQDALAEFIAGACDSRLHGAQLQQATANIRFYFNAINVYHQSPLTTDIVTAAKAGVH